MKKIIVEIAGKKYSIKEGKQLGSATKEFIDLCGSPQQAIKQIESYIAFSRKNKKHNVTNPVHGDISHMSNVNPEGHGMRPWHEI